MDHPPFLSRYDLFSTRKDQKLISLAPKRSIILRMTKGQVVSALLLFLCGTSKSSYSQTLPGGNYSGLLGHSIQVVLHLNVPPGGKPTASIDIPARGLVGVPCTDVDLTAKTFSFDLDQPKGSYLGKINPDGASIQGFWTAAGTPGMTLNFSRSAVESASAQSASPPTSQTAALSASPAGAVIVNSCTQGSRGNYWDGTSWKPLMLPDADKSKGDISITQGLKHNPLDITSGGRVLIMRFHGPSSPTVLGPTPKFSFPVPAIATVHYKIGILKVKGDERELEYSRYGSGDSWLEKSEELDADVKRVSDNCVEVTPTAPLKPGQYVVTPALSATAMYDFAVQ